MSFTVKFVDDEDGCIQVKEDFICFWSVDNSSGKGLTELFMNILNDNKIKLQECCSQGYDNGVNMKGRNSGIQARIPALNPKAFFVPCGCHSLNLVVSDAALDSVSVFRVLQRIYILVSASINRWKRLTDTVTNLTMKPLSDTSWESYIDSVRPVRYQVTEVYDALMERVQSSKAETRSRHEMQSLMDFVTATTSMRSCLDFVVAYRDERFEDAIPAAKEMAENLGVQPVFKKTRIHRKKRQFGYEGRNEVMGSLEEKFKRGFFCSLIDTVQVSIEESPFVMSGPAWSWPFMMRHWNKQPLRRDPATAVAGSVVSPRPVRVQTVLPSMFDAGVGIMQSWFCACWDSSWVLYTCVLLVLVIWVAMATQHSFSWRSRMALLVSRLRWRGTEDEGEGAKKRRVKQPRDRLCWDPPRRARRATRRRSLRQLLCDNSDCALCNEAARQAERLVYADRASAWVPAGPGSPPTPASGSKGRNLLGRSMWRGLDVLQWCGSRTSMGDQVLPPAQSPFPPSKSRSPPERQAGSRKTECRPPREDEKRLSRPQQAKGSSTEQDECLFCSSLWDETLLRGQEQAQSSSSLQHEPPLLAWELRNGSSQHEPFLPRHKEHPGPAPAQHEPFPPSQAEHGWVGSFLRRGRARSPQAAPQRHVHRPDWVPFLAKSPGGTRMSGRKAKWH
ncbi:uncharacterized protein LOC123361855 [Mauremys mutica]|uniref:uncharacterized protein LOC123361855 n=1 Tax=Mauremys mutica TaxID=74926 RepID=UPI001D15B3D3|nr:uncharacterized protein LOC123361855 [Mauremys mutica]